jgi:ribonuclease E
MTVVDVNTGKYTGAGGNLEETVTRNNLEAAEEIVRQLRLRDFGGIIVIDFIDMVLESNRELVLRRLTECLGRDRTKHQVTEITSLGLVQMTRKRIGQGLLEAFSEPCEHCKGRGVIIHLEPAPERKGERESERVEEPGPAESGRRRGRRGRGSASGATEVAEPAVDPAEPAGDLAEPAADDSAEPALGDAGEPVVSAPSADDAVAASEPATNDGAAESSTADGATAAPNGGVGEPGAAWPPATSSWVNLGAVPPAPTIGESNGPPAGDDSSPSLVGPAPDIEHLESEASDGGGVGGRRRRVPRWRLRP